MIQVLCTSTCVPASTARVQTLCSCTGSKLSLFVGDACENVRNGYVKVIAGYFNMAKFAVVTSMQILGSIILIDNR